MSKFEELQDWWEKLGHKLIAYTLITGIFLGLVCSIRFYLENKRIPISVLVQTILMAILSIQWILDNIQKDTTKKPKIKTLKCFKCYENDPCVLSCKNLFVSDAMVPLMFCPFNPSDKGATWVLAEEDV